MPSNTAVANPQQLLTPEQAADLLGITPKTLAQWRSSRRYAMPFVRVGRLIRYRRSAIEAWITRNTEDN